MRYFHAVALTAAESKSTTLLLSNSIEFAFGLLAGVSAAYASRQVNRFGKHFWLLISAGFFVWSAGENETAFLQKPFTPLSLTRKVRKVLDGAAVR